MQKKKIIHFILLNSFSNGVSNGYKNSSEKETGKMRVDGAVASVSTTAIDITR